MFFGNNISLYALLFILLGIIAYNKDGHVMSTNSINTIVFVGLLSTLIIGSFGYHAYYVYGGQYKFLQSLITNDALARYELQSKAITFDPRESVYRRSFIDTNLFIARSLSQVENPTETDTTQVQQLVSQSVEEARVLTEIVNPLDVGNWEARGQVYDALSGVAENADQFAVSAYTNAINLQSTSPRLWLSLGSVYYRQKSYQNAVQAFSRSVQLKNDYPNAHYNLAFALNDAGDPISAVTQLEIVQRLIPAGTEDAKRLAEDIVAMKKLAAVLAAKLQDEAAARVEQEKNILQGQNPDAVMQKSPVIEPLSNPSEQSQTQIDSNVDLTEDAMTTEAPLANPPTEAN